MILAIDTSTQWIGLALFDGAQILYSKVWRTSRRHTVELVPAIQAALAESGVEFAALKAPSRLGPALSPACASAWLSPGIPSRSAYP